jgi:hypothetical protein
MSDEVLLLLTGSHPSDGRIDREDEDALASAPHSAACVPVTDEESGRVLCDQPCRCRKKATIKAEIAIERFRGIVGDSSLRPTEKTATCRGVLFDCDRQMGQL